MKRLLRIPNTLFVRLFALLVTATFLSHILAIFVFTEIFHLERPHHEPPPGGPPQFESSVVTGTPPPPPPDELHRHRHGPFSYPFRILIVNLLGLGIAAWFGARMLASPVQKLSKAATQLSQSLISSPIDEDSGPLEARQAARAFNRMQSRLRRQMEERERFLAAVSHDLRTPLTRMKLYLEGKDLAEYKARIQQEINEMAAMLDQTLDYLRGQAQPEAFQRLDVRALLEAMAEDAEALGQAVTFEGEAAPVMAQSRSLTRCVNNLVQNALRYGKTAHISLKEEGEQIVIEIADDGPGIPQEMLQRVFEPFVRLEESRSKATGGVGLGLSIARGIARQHGGELSLYNATQGGLVARLTLPKNH